MAGLSEAAAGGDRRAVLEALRDVLAESIGSVDEKYRAPLAKQLREVMAELDGLPVKGASAVDELASKRRRRKSGVSDSTGTG